LAPSGSPLTRVDIIVGANLARHRVHLPLSIVKIRSGCRTGFSVAGFRGGLEKMLPQRGTERSNPSPSVRLGYWLPRPGATAPRASGTHLLREMFGRMATAAALQVHYRLGAGPAHQRRLDPGERAVALVDAQVFDVPAVRDEESFARLVQRRVGSELGSDLRARLPTSRGQWSSFD
jgi:hypothetical protein